MARAPLPIGAWGSVSVRPRGSAWQACTRVRDRDGVVRQVRAQAPTKGGARKALAAALATRTAPAGAGALVRTSTVSTLLTAWLVEVERVGRVRPQTVEAYRRACQDVIVPQLGAWRLYEVTPVRVQEVLVSTTPGRRRAVRTVLKQAFAYARRAGVDVADPVEATVIPPHQRREPDALTPEQVAALRAAVRRWQEARPVSNGVLAPAVDLMLGTGMRVGEVCALTWQQVRLSDPARVRVEATMTVRGGHLVRQEAPKTGAGVRTLFLPPFAVQALVELGPRAGGPVLSTRAGTHVSPANLRRSLRSATASLDFEVTPHTLRRTVATVLERSAGVRAAADQLGHADPEVTGRHYVVPRREGPRATDLLQQALGGH